LDHDDAPRGAGGLRFGADDLDGTVVEEKILSRRWGKDPQGMTRQQSSA